MRKKLFALLLTLILVLSLCACTSAQDSDEIPPPQSTTEEKDNANSEEPDVTKEPDVTEEPTTELNYPITLSEQTLKKMEKCLLNVNDVNELFLSIENSINNYCKEYDIDPKDFVWPEYKVDGLTEFDEDNCWMYLNVIYSNYCFTGERYLTEGFENELPSEEHIALMNTILDGMADWGEEHQSETFDSGLLLGLFQDQMFPLGEKLPEIIVFTNE